MWAQLASQSISVLEACERLDRLLLDLFESHKLPRDLAYLILGYRTEQDRFDSSLSSIHGVKLLIELKRPFLFDICSLFTFPNETLRLCDSTLAPVPYLVLQRNRTLGIWRTPTSAMYHTCKVCKKLTKKICSQCHAEAFCSKTCLKKNNRLHMGAPCTPLHPTLLHFCIPVSYVSPYGNSLKGLILKFRDRPPWVNEEMLPPVPQFLAQPPPPRSHQALFTIQCEESHTNVSIYLLTVSQRNISKPVPLAWELLGELSMRDIKVIQPAADTQALPLKLVWVPFDPTLENTFL
jgi:hypothetical protein